MSEHQPHPLLAQVPLTVSPFVSLPTATTLPYTYRAVPTSLPPSATTVTTSNADGSVTRPKYVVSSSGRAAHPADVAASCRALETHLARLQTESQSALEKWQADLAAMALAEKRKLAPGWLDRDEKILSPTRTEANASLGTSLSHADADSSTKDDNNSTSGPQPDNEGLELDRAFGQLRT